MAASRINMRGARKALAGVALGLLLPLAACNNSPEAQVERALAEMERQEPVFALLKQHEPSAYQDMRALIERTVRQGGEPNQTQLIQRSREILARTIERRVMTAPDETVKQLVAFVGDQATHLESNPQVCANLLKGTAGDVRSFIPAEMQQRERRLYEDLLKAPNNGPQPVANEEQAGAVLEQILTEAQGALGMDQAGVASALQGTAAPANVCRANAYLMRRLGELPPNQGAPIFRFLSQAAAQQRPPSPMG